MNVLYKFMLEDGSTVEEKWYVSAEARDEAEGIFCAEDLGQQFKEEKQAKSVSFTIVNAWWREDYYDIVLPDENEYQLMILN